MWGGKRFCAGVSHCSSASLPGCAFELFGFGCGETEAEGHAVLLAQRWEQGLEDRDPLEAGRGAHDAVSVHGPVKGSPKLRSPQGPGY